ncbi:hypothetical protein CR162_21590 [Pseudoroseomonas rhizosphaerae]|uniref:Uncharacterized protein n=1 Tax=Teichococcus rhizosphaerae TaxID=1335062 RepID=A0A2C6ZYK3_9PROT|nr:hypothetical protein [Pseudoroseomonas rhizosphaerae]PHK92888.1 hypothetical protein CR162_21590 [Pseudoroseomonas rhizosphaerae]
MREALTTPVRTQAASRSRSYQYAAMSLSSGRPAMFRRQGSPEDFVLYLPISHTPPSDEEEGIELPDSVKAKAGLDSAPQWVRVSECNIDTWPADLRQLPQQPGRFHYGHLPPSMFKIIRGRFVERYNDRRTKLVNRGGS